MKCKLVIISCGYLLAFFCTSAQTPNEARQTHYATSRIEIIKRDESSRCAHPCPHCSLRFSTSLDPELSQIVSKPVLTEVANKLDLAAKWNLPPDDVYKRIQENLKVKHFTITPIVSIVAGSEDAAEAAAISSEIARTFHRIVEEKNNKAREARHLAFEKILQAEQEKTKQAELKFMALRKEQGLPEKYAQDDDATRKLRLKALQEDRLKVKVKMLTAEARLKQWDQMKDKPLLERAVLADDPFVRDMIKRIQESKTTLSEKMPALGAEHPEVKREQAVLDALNRKLETTLADIQESLQKKLPYVRKKLDACEKKIAEISPQAENPETRKARTEFETQQSIFESLKERALPAYDPPLSVVIISLADPNKPAE